MKKNTKTLTRTVCGGNYITTTVVKELS